MFQNRQYGEAINAAESAYQLFQGNDTCFQLEILSLLGLSNSRLKDNEKASNLLEQAQLLLEKYRCNESYVLARYFQAAAEITAITGQSEVAITYYQESLAQIDISDENEIDSRVGAVFGQFRGLK